MKNLCRQTEMMNEITNEICHPIFVTTNEMLEDTKVLGLNYYLIKFSLVF